MPRPFRCRRIGQLPVFRSFSPDDVKDSEKVLMTVDEFERVYGEPGDRYERELREIYNGLAVEGKVPLKPHTIELLSSMKKAGMKIAIASSSTREEVTSQMAALGALPYFDTCVCGDQVTRSKPDPEIFLLACDALGVKPEEGVGLDYVLSDHGELVDEYYDGPFTVEVYADGYTMRFCDRD